MTIEEQETALGRSGEAAVNIQKLMLPVVVVAAISTMAFADAGVVGRDMDPITRLTAMGTPIGPKPHLTRGDSTPRLEPELGGNPGDGDLGGGQPESILAGTTSNPIPHFQLPLLLIGLVLEIDSSPDSYENLFVQQVAGAVSVLIDAF